MTVTPQAELRLPELLRGPWDHAVLLSYGIDLPFFERALARQLPPTCRNRILLGDERTYLASCDAYARGGLVRSANRTYIAEPILRRSHSHAKVILLASPTAGRLLIGSGNISRQGFASGGELFTRYDYGQAGDDTLAEFVAVRTLLERLRDDGLLTAPAAWHIDRLLEETGWLYGVVVGAAPRLRHNLDRSFADQLEAAIGGRRVEELVVMAPFFDEELVALRTLISRLHPGRTTVLVQQGRTSIDPDALERVRTTSSGSLSVRPVERLPHRPWIHAKLILARTTSGDVCLQGSANISVAALSTGTEANLEVVNLLSSHRGAFDAVLGDLNIGEAVEDLALLELGYRSSDIDDPLTEAGWQLTAAEWLDEVLEVRFRGELPSLDGATVESAGNTLAMEVIRLNTGSFTAHLYYSHGGRAAGITPIRLNLADGGVSNGIFPADRGALSDALELGVDSGEKLARIGDIGLDDDELEQLLQELEATLVLDRRSVWQLAGRPLPPDDDDQPDEPHINYADIDYEMLRSHPKMQQYLRSGGIGQPRSRLQIVLNAITAAFADLSAADAAAAIADAANAHQQGDAASGTTEQDEDEERPRRRWAVRTRFNVLFRNFVRRFLRGLGSQPFQELAGPAVLVRNYVVFLHLLSCLAEREWIDQSFVIDRIGRTLALFWGDSATPGYIARLEPDERDELLKVIRELHSDARLIATLYNSSLETSVTELRDLRVHLRDAWCGILVRGDLPLSPTVLAEARLMLIGADPPQGPLPSTVVDELTRLAQHVTPGELVEAVAARLGVRETACVFDTDTVHSPLLGTVNVRALRVEDDSARLTVEDARWALQHWMAVEQLPHYRVAVTSRDGRQRRYVAFYEPGGRRGRYAAPAEGRPGVALSFLGPLVAPWDDAIIALMYAANEATAAAQSDSATA